MGNVIKLGAVGALRNYTLKPQGDTIAWGRSNANPFSAKVNTSSKYDEVDIWNEWVQEDWQQGVGRVDPEAGGFLYGETETRVPNQMILPPLVRQVDTFEVTGAVTDCRYMPENMAGEFTVGGTGSYSRMAVPFTTPSSNSPDELFLWIYANITSDVAVNFEIWSNSGGKPSAKLSSTYTYTPEESVPGWYWHGVSASYSLSDSTTYWLVVYPSDSSDTFKVGYGTTVYTSGNTHEYNGFVWTATTGQYLMYSTSIHWLNQDTTFNATGSAFARFNGYLYCIFDQSIYKYDPADDQWDLIDTDTYPLLPAGATSFGSYVYFWEASNAIGGGTKMNGAESVSATDVGQVWAKYGPYIYRANYNQLYYSSDVESNGWSAAFDVGSNEFSITGMAGMGDSLFVATAEALYRFAPGDVVEGITAWGSIDDTNGVGMLNYQGALYFVLNGRVSSFTQDGRVQDVWVNRDDDVIPGRIGKVWDLCRMNNWLVALVSNPGSTGKPTVWAYQDGAWHHLATLPSTDESATNPYSYYKIYYDRGTSSLWASTPSMTTFRIYVPDYALNPYNDGNNFYMPRAWFEQDRYYGGMMLVDKAYDSVTILGDNLSTNVNVKVYWQEPDSTAWEYLGTIDEDSEEVRWPIASRPIGRWLKLGLLLQTNDGDETPRIRAVVVKNLPFPNDRRQENVTLTLKNYIEMPDGTKDSYTLAQQLAHIESMIATKGTFIYQDPFGVQYEVTIPSYQMGSVVLDNQLGTNVVREMDITLILEQVPDTAYT